MYRRRYEIKMNKNSKEYSTYRTTSISSAQSRERDLYHRLPQIFQQTGYIKQGYYK